MHDLEVLSVTFGPVLWQINGVRVNRCVRTGVCLHVWRCETKSCDNCLEGERTWEGFILHRPGWSLLECLQKEQLLIVSISSKSVLAVRDGD